MEQIRRVVSISNGKRRRKSVSREITLDVLEMLIKKPRTIAELAEVTGSNGQTIQRHLETLEKLCFAMSTLSNRSRVWSSLVELSESGEDTTRAILEPPNNFSPGRKITSSRELMLYILLWIMKRPRTVRELIDKFYSKEETVRKHLKSLAEFSFVVSEGANPKIWRSHLRQINKN